MTARIPIDPSHRPVELEREIATVEDQVQAFGNFDATPGPLLDRLAALIHASGAEHITDEKDYPNLNRADLNNIGRTLKELAERMRRRLEQIGKAG